MNLGFASEVNYYSNIVPQCHQHDRQPIRQSLPEEHMPLIVGYRIHSVTGMQVDTTGQCSHLSVPFF
jgi:hypothetical protein